MPRLAAPAPRPDADSLRPTSVQLIRIEGELRQCAAKDALWQHLANEPVMLLPFDTALVFEAGGGRRRMRWKAVAVSALAQVHRDAPMTRWYEDMVAKAWSSTQGATGVYLFELSAHADLSDPCADDAALAHLMWVPLVDLGQPVRAGWLLARRTPWEPAHQTLAARLAAAYAHGLSAIEGRAKPPAPWRRHRIALALAGAAAVLALVFVQVPLTTLAPVEVMPEAPFVVAAPVPGVVERILVAPGTRVSEGSPLVQLVDTTLRSDFEVAGRKLGVARARKLRLQQAAVVDPTAKRELAIARSEELVARAERDYARAMLEKAVIRAPREGVVLYGDPRDWMGRPVAVGEAIMRVADPGRVEYRIKVAVADAVNLRENASVKVFLDAAPLAPFDARVVRAAYRAEADAAGVSSYVVTARPVEPYVAPERLGLRGTARLYGEPVSLLYYLLRRPITAARQWTGL
ncbi:HlyD family efflux transporter periplasmic adaptor subunit [Variovorax sp. TBS-050B]|uniref:HlyD family efflux transporter periplasmic adaptor subunit n=1 Tax=Variovorax sp. TBS-050B TaxID=2940551 RepID=UPI0024744113|nr:HlyD family efflux transporter periplasmic adaptor subunit [Variovorax sp. TBS-050B]